MRRWTPIALLLLGALACDDDAPEEPTSASRGEERAERSGDEGRAEPVEEATPAHERMHFDLARHVARAELAEGDALLVDFGTPGAAKYTLGGWRTRTDGSHTFGEVSTTLIEGVTGEVILPVAEAGPHVLRLRARAFGDGRLTVYLDGDTVHHDRLPTDGSFDTVTVALDALEPGEHALQLRVPERGRDDGFRAGIALDWMRLSPGAAPAESDDEGAAPDDPPPVLAAGDALQLPAGLRLGYAMVVPEGARLRGVAQGGALTLRAARDGAEPVDLGRHEGELDVDLGPLAGQLVRLELGARADLDLARPRVVTLADAAPALAAAPPARNVLVYLVDTVRADKLSPWNPDTRVRTPGLDRWVREAAVFEHGWAQENWTKPSVATLLSGLLPWQHTATGGEAVLPRAVEMMSETLREAGFHTGAFVCNGYVSDKFGFEQGWTTWRNYIREGRRSAARFVAADVLEWLDARPEDRPFFLYVHTIDPHVPYIPPDELIEEYDPGPYDGPVDFRRDRELLEKIKAGTLRVNARDRQRLEALYDGEITYHDTHFASILDGLARRGLAEETLVVFTADHGEEFFDHESVGHGHTLYEELLHVPLVMRVPGLTDGSARVPGAVGLVDVAPTAYDALGLDADARPEGLPGRSLLPLLRGETSDAPRARIAGFMEGWRAVVVGRWKLIQRTHRRWMLHDLAEDPGEERDLAAERPLAVRWLRGMLGLAQAGHTMPRAEAETTEIDPETDAQLRALGYVGTQRPE